MHSHTIRPLTPQPTDRGRADSSALKGEGTEKDFIGRAVLSTTLFPSLWSAIVLKLSLTAGVAGVEAAPPPPMVMRPGVRAQRFPRKTQARAGIGKADRASLRDRGSNVTRIRAQKAPRPHRQADGTRLPHTPRAALPNIR